MNRQCQIRPTTAPLTLILSPRCEGRGEGEGLAFALTTTIPIIYEMASKQVSAAMGFQAHP